MGVGQEARRIAMQAKPSQINKKKPIRSKKAYKTPALVHYGKLIELTAGGTGINAEHASSGSPSSWRPA
jgi:hypothetical protein